MNDIIISGLFIGIWIWALSWVERDLNAVEKRYIRLSVGLHLVCALTMGPITLYLLGGGDMYGYHLAGTQFAQMARDDPFRVIPALIELSLRTTPSIPLLDINPGSATATMNGMVGLLYLFTNDSLYGACILIAAGTFFAKVVIYRVFRHSLPELPITQVLVAALLIPSVVYWSSGILKEPVAMLGFGLIWSGIFRVLAKKVGPRAILQFGSGVVLVGLIKAYWLVPLGAALGAWFAAQSLRAKLVMSTRLLLLLFGAILAGGLISGTAALFPRYSVDRLASESAQLRGTYARVEGGSSYSLIDSDEEDEERLPVSALPLALTSVLLRPVVFEARTGLQIINSLEMAVFAFLLLRAWLRKGLLGSVRACVASPFLVFCCVFVLGLSVGVGLSTTNMGSLSRYRIPIMPFYAIILIALGHQAHTPSRGRSPASSLASRRQRYPVGLR